MNKQLLLTVLLLVLVASQSASAAAPQSPIPGVQDLDASSFDSVVSPTSDHYVFVEFYAPWCQHCKNFVSEFTVLAKALSDAPSDVESKLILVKVNAEESKDLANRYEINGFPTLLLFAPGSENPIVLSGKRSAHWIARQLSDHIPQFPLLVPEPPKDKIAYVTELDEKNFKSIVYDENKDVLVLFYAPWCRFCHALRGPYRRLGEIFQNDGDNVVIARIDATEPQHAELASQHNIKSFPTIYFYARGKAKTPVLYSGGRTVEELLHFVNSVSQWPRLLDGDLSWNCGVSPKLNEFAHVYAYGNNEEKRIESLKAFHAALKEVEGAGVAVYKEIMEKMSANPDEAYGTLSAEAKALENQLLKLPRGPERDAIALKLNVCNAIMKYGRNP